MVEAPFSAVEGASVPQGCFTSPGPLTHFRAALPSEHPAVRARGLAAMLSRACTLEVSMASIVW